MRRTVLLGIGILAATLAVYLTDRAVAGGDKALHGSIKKLAATIKKGDDVKSDAESLAKKEEVEEIMEVFKPRKKGGIGVGAPGAVTPDGIELKLINLGRDAPSPAALGKEAAALEEMAYIVAAVAKVTHAKAPTSNQGKKTVKDWKQWSSDMHDASIKLAEAAKSKSASDVKTAASKVNAACNSCHSVFR